MHEKKKSSVSGSSEPYKVQIECIFDDLSEAQIKKHEQRFKEYNEFKKKFDQFALNRHELNIEKGEQCTFVEWVSQQGVTSIAASPTAIPVVPVSTSSIQKQNGRVTHTSPSQNNQILLVNNQRGCLTGLIVPTASMQAVTSSVGSSCGTPVNVVNVSGTNKVITTATGTPGSLISTPKTSVISSRISSPQVSSQSKAPPNVTVVPAKTTQSLSNTIIVHNRNITQSAPLKRPLEVTLPTNKPSKPLVNVSAPPVIASTTDKTEQPRKSKLSYYPAPEPTVSIDLTEDLSKIEGVGGPSGKTYPSLVVMAKPCMRNEKESKSPTIMKEKQALDTQVRRVLLFTAQNFTEWLIQTGLLRCDHYCSLHTTDDSNKIKLKLGQYTDTNKFPFSGGYVWVSDCCPQTYISVFSGSIFEGASYPPTSTMKLIYHWACHTSIQNILQWVNVTNVYIKNLFTNLRAVCTAAVHEHYEKMGGKGSKVQVGVVSLGTTSKESVTKKVRVDILCLLDPETKVVRIRAVEPTPDPDRFILRKFTKIFEIMPLWVDKDTTILVDNTIERSVLFNMGYKSVSQTFVLDKKGDEQYPNYEVMDYLRQIVPKMFQNTLSILSRQVIQQFLDELCWRERWGPFPSRAFDTIIKHLIEQTKINSGATLLNRLSKISANPFKDWKYSKWRANCISKPSGGVKPPTPIPGSGCGGIPQKIVVTKDTQLVVPPSIPIPLESQMEAEPSQMVTLMNNRNQPSITVEAAKILLEPYFYGTIKGDEKLQKRKQEFSVNCVICRKLLTNNVELTDHLIKHGVSSFNSADTRELCKICCKIMPSLFTLQQHHIMVHSTPGIPNSSQWCLMCNSRFRDTPSLIGHMSKYHGELELPYACDVCFFRTSIFVKMVGHIHDCHKKDQYGFCPYCFQSFNFYSFDKPSSKAQYKFLYHIQRHQMFALAKKCFKCNIACINKTILNEHEVKAHKSFSNIDDVERYTTESDTLMPAPLEDPVAPKGEKFKPAVGGPYKVVNFPSPLAIDDRDSETQCIECDAKIDDNHFMSELLCMKCDFSTCCIRAMNEHHHSIHGYAMPKIFKSIPVFSDTNLNCSCSFTTKDGNAMANHLVMCKKTTCYEDPTNPGSTDIQSVIGQKSTEDDESNNDDNLNITYTIAPGPSSSKSFINDATFIVN